VFVQLNRSAGLQLLAHELRHERIRLPKWNEDSQNNPFLDLNSWYEDYQPQPDGRDLYKIMRSVATPDDVGMAIMYGLFTCYRRCNAWPRFQQSLGAITYDESFNNPAAAGGGQPV
jgi:hypothetical protein